MAPETKTPSNDVWVGNLSSEVTDSDLKNLFSKYGNVHSVTAPTPSRNYAFVYFNRIEDAKAAVKGLQGSVLRGNEIRVNFSKPAKPCRSLWVSGISPSVTMETLLEEFLKFGKIQEFKFSRDHKTAHVDYFRLEDASQALKGMNGKQIDSDKIRVDFLRPHTSKRENFSGNRDPREGQFLSQSMVLLDSPRMPQDVRNYSELSKRQQGRLLDDAKISIMYSSSDVGGSKDYARCHSATQWPGTDVLSTESSYQSSHMDTSSYDMIPNTLTGHVPFRDMVHKLHDSNPNSLIGSQNWRTPSPAPVMLPSPSLHVKQPIGPVPGAGDVINVSQLQRKPKRSRIETVWPVFGSPSPSKALEDRPMGLCQFGHERDYKWRCIIAKGGTSVCRARCVPVGKGIESEIPDVVNCSAKIDLDVLLAKHFTEAMGCNVVYFLPDSEEDVGSYTEFLQYLGVKNLAEVAIFDDGTALFFVPPSDVLSKVLKLPSPKCLYGVILNSRQNPCSTSMRPQSQSHYMNRQQRPPLPLSTEVDRGLLPKDSKFDCQGNTLTTHQLHESENQFNPQGQFSQLHTYTTSLNTSRSSSTVVTGNPQFQDPAFNLPQQGAISSRPLSTFGIPSQGGQHQYELPENVDKDFRIVEQTDFLGSYCSSSSQQRENSITRVYDTSVVQTYTAMPLAADKGNSALGNQLQNPQSAGNGASQRTSEGEDNKYQRYMATVELAANILRERQKQQQSSNQAGKGCATPKQDFHQLALSIFWRTKLDGQPGNVLWMGYPPSVCIDEQMLHNVMMMFGEVETIMSFPSHDFSCGEFKSVMHGVRKDCRGDLLTCPGLFWLFINCMKQRIDLLWTGSLAMCCGWVTLLQLVLMSKCCITR